MQKFFTIVILLAVFQNFHDVIAKNPKAINRGKKSKAVNQGINPKPANPEVNNQIEAKINPVPDEGIPKNPKATNQGKKPKAANRKTAKRNSNLKPVVNQGVTNQEEVKLDIVANQGISTNPKATNPGSVKNHRVAIIGNTISGALSSYYLRELYPNIEIHVYEHVINREVDADLACHQNSQYMNEIVKEKGINLIDYFRNGVPLIYDGVNNNQHLHKEVFEKQNPNLYKKLLDFITSSFKDFKKIYKLQSEKKSFKNVKDLLSALSPDFEEYLGKTMNEFLDENMSNDSNWKNFLEAMMVGTYVQKFNVHTFVGLACLWYSELTGPIKQMAKDYEEIVKKLFNEKDELYKNEVVLSTNWKNKKIHVTSYNHKEKKKQKNSYDFVIIAKAETNFSETKSPRKDNCEYNNTFLTIFKGSVKIDCCKSGNPASITHDIINIQKGFVTAPNKERPGLWGMATTHPILQQEGLFSDIFYLPVLIDCSVKLDGYPNYSKLECAEQAKFDLGRNLYHVNAIAWAASYPEMMAIGAKNVALLISSKIG